MFDYIRGKVTNKKVDYVTLDVNGIGYKIHISLNTFDKVKESEVRLYIHNYVREDAFILYGFYDENGIFHCNLIDFLLKKFQFEPISHA